MQSIYHKIDSSTLAALDVCQYDENPKEWIITRINVPTKHRNKGCGNKLLNECCAQADIENITLFLEIFPSGDLDYNQLVSWYKSKGFKGNGIGVMKRIPNV